LRLSQAILNVIAMGIDVPVLQLGAPLSIAEAKQEHLIGLHIPDQSY
jgi:hypothetical protein